MLELLRAHPQRVHKVVVEAGREFAEIEKRAHATGRAIEVVDRRTLEHLLDPGVARGVVAIAQSPLLDALEPLLENPRLDVAAGRRGRRVLVALDGVLDPRNLGAIMRSAEFFGAHGLFYARDRAAPLSAVAVRASAGASERLPVACVPNLSRALEQCKQAGFWVVGTVVDDGQDAVTLADELPDAFVLVLGSEERGLRRLTRERCDFLASIPGSSALGSLNVSCAASVALAMLT